MDIVGLIDAVRGIFDNFKSGMFIGVSALLYLVIQLLRGKAGFAIPWVTDKFNSIKSTALKTGIILGLFTIIGGLVSFASGKPFTFDGLLDSALAGLTLGFGTLGIRTAAKNTMESDGFKQLVDQIKQTGKKDGQA